MSLGSRTAAPRLSDLLPGFRGLRCLHEPVASGGRSRETCGATIGIAMKGSFGLLLSASGIACACAGDLSSTDMPQRNTNAPAAFGQRQPALFEPSSFTLSLYVKPQTVVVQNPRIEEVIDWKKNWVFHPPLKPSPQPSYMLDWNFEQRIQQGLEKLHRTNRGQ